MSLNLAALNLSATCGYPGCQEQPIYGIYDGKVWCQKHQPMPWNQSGAKPSIEEEALTHEEVVRVNRALELGEKQGHISVKDLISMRERLNDKADEILLKKGNDYNAQQQQSGDTLFNLRICAILGIVPSPIEGILVRMSDKLARLVSLTRPGVVQQVSDESLEDTVVDLRNYADYLLAMVKESKGQEIK